MPREELHTHSGEHMYLVNSAVICVL
eukprot:COSAG06_NODE_38768_length_420_cov_0.635514_1_plen_25_part_01